MSRRKRQVVEDEDPGLDMSSLIDVSFLLLVYFIATSSLEPKEADLSMTMPSSSGAPSADVGVDPMSITVNALGGVEVDGEVIDSDVNDRYLPNLLDRLRTYAKGARVIDEEPVVIISSDDAANSQRFVDVLNALSDEKVRIENVTISGFDSES